MPVDYKPYFPREEFRHEVSVSEASINRENPVAHIEEWFDEHESELAGYYDVYGTVHGDLRFFFTHERTALLFKLRWS